MAFLKSKNLDRYFGMFSQIEKHIYSELKEEYFIIEDLNEFLSWYNNLTTKLGTIRKDPNKIAEYAQYIHPNNILGKGTYGTVYNIDNRFALK